MSFDASADLALFDNLEAITVHAAGSKSMADSGVSTESGGTNTFTNALRRQVSARLAESSGGMWKVGDVYFEVSRVDVALQPQVGDTITATDGVWRVLGADICGLVTRWRVYARR